MSDTNRVPFRPVRGKDEAIKNSSTVEGYVYYATDTRKTYLGTASGEKLLMGYDTGIFFGTKQMPEDNSGNLPDPEVYFNILEIEGSRLPMVGDLILNVDGCFYRVEIVMDSENVKTKRLTLQGTGGGGGGGTGGVGGSSFNISFTNTSKQFAYSTEATSMDISFISYYNGSDDNFLSSVAFYLESAADPFYTTSVNKDGEKLVFNKTHTIDLIQFKSMFGSTNTSVKVAIFDKYGNERSDIVKIKTVAISLTATMPALFHTTTSERTYGCSLAGATTGVSDKKITYRLYNETNPDTVLATIEQNLNISDEGTIQKTLDFSDKDHGIYILKVQASATILGTVNTIYSNTLTHKVAYFTANGEPLLMVLAPEKTEQYTNIPVDYLFVTAEAGKTYTLEIKLNNQTYRSLEIQSNTLDTYNFYFEEKGAYQAQFTVVEAGIISTIPMVITPYTGNLPVIDPTRDDLMLYLNPRGKTNTGVDRAEWSDYNGRYSATLSGLHYGSADGWLMDHDGTTYLKLTSGATLNMSDFKPFEYDPTVFSESNSRAGYGLTIELDFEINGILDYDVPSITCISYDQTKKIPQCGFEVVGDKIKMYNSELNGQIDATTGKSRGVLASQTLVEGKRMRLSFVIEPKSIKFPMCYTYLNGKLSSAVIYGENDKFKDGFHPATLNINSSAAQIKVYGIRFYSSALNDKTILNNYTTTFASLADRQNNYNTNNVFNAKGEVDFNLVAAEEYDLQIPYMKLTGGYKTVSSDEKWTLPAAENMKAGLPTGKKDYRLVDVEVVYPKYTQAEIEAGEAYFADYKDYSFINQFDGGVKMSAAAGKKPNNGGAIMYAQGTSSMEYPIKNLRLRFNKVKTDPEPKKNFYTVRPDISPVEIICMKADYMESSGSHNTGAANFVDALYKGVNIKTPGQEHFGGEGKDTIVTCIKGHPCLIFYSESGEPGTYQYIGKYNLNLDKATPEPFGFNHDDSDFGYLTPGDEYYAIQYDDDGDKFIGQEDSSAGGDYDDTKEGEELKIVQEGEKINAIHCFEFLDNAIKVCNFLNTEDKDIDGNTITNYHDTWYNTFWDAKEKREAPGWTLGFESRYPEDRIGYHDADMLYPLAAWLHELYNIRYGLEDHAEEGANAALANARFANEYQCYLDKDFLLTYYLVTEALLMADSRVKNMMIATWGKGKRSYYPLKLEKGKYVSDTTAAPVEMNNYIFYPIFYDMDTMLGLDNTGVARFNYYDEDTDAALYNGDEVLWNFVRDSLSAELIQWYSKLEESLMNSDNILPYFNRNQANMANEAFYNGDAQYKYITPARKGYHDDLYDKDIAPGAAPYLYAAQGDRSLMRESFVTNRIRFLRGKYASNKFQGSDRIVFRWYYPDENDSDPNLAQSASPDVVPASGTFNLTSLKTGFAGIQLGANGTIVAERFNGEEQKEITLDATSANGTEAYILGLSGLSDMGDLSNKYMQKFIMESTDIRLKKLILGNPHKLYYNPYWNTTVDGQSAAIVLGGYNEETGQPYGCLYLEEFNLQNCATFNNTLDFSVCSAIEKIYLTGSNVRSVTLPVNGLLTELRLPTSVHRVQIEGHSGLTDAGFSLGGYSYGPNNKIGGEGGSYTNDFSDVTELYIVNTPINTYNILKEAEQLDGYYLQGINWNITTVDPDQYCKRTSSWKYVNADGETVTLGEAVPAGVYYSYNIEDDSYELYNETTYPTGDFLYEKFSMIKDNKVVCIPMLEQLQTKNLLKGSKHAEALAGTITINLDVLANGTKIQVNELELYRRYAEIYPNISISYGSNMDVEGASRINFYRIDSETMSGMNIADAEPYFSTLTAKDTYTLAQLIDTNAFVNPVKNPIVSHTYTFTGRWIDWADPAKQVYYQDTVKVQDGFKKENGDLLFSTFKPSGQMQLVPIFKVDVRQYQVTLYDYDGSTILTTYMDYNSDVGEYFDQHIGDNPNFYHAYYNYREYTNEAQPDNRWAFKGWQNTSDWKGGAAEATYTYLTGRKVTSDVVFYAFYKEENVYSSVSMVGNKTDFFTYTEGVTVNGVSGAEINLANKYRYILKGKVTLPATSPAGTPIISVGNFNARNTATNIVENDTQITHIYFENADNNSYLAISNGAFSTEDGSDSRSGLEVIELPASLIIIEGSAFKTNLHLKSVKLHNNIVRIAGSAFWNCKGISSFGIEGLPTALSELGTAAFYNAGPGLVLTALPASLRSLESWAFAGCPNVNIDTFGSESAPMVRIGSSAFDQCGDNSITSMTIYCNNGAIEKNAFSNYKVNVSNLIIYSPAGVEEPAEWNLRMAEGATITQQKLATGG